MLSNGHQTKNNYLTISCRVLTFTPTGVTAAAALLHGCNVLCVESRFKQYKNLRNFVQTHLTRYIDNNPEFKSLPANDPIKIGATAATCTCTSVSTHDCISCAGTGPTDQFVLCYYCNAPAHRNTDKCKELIDMDNYDSEYKELRLCSADCKSKFEKTPGRSKR